jgi:hypothetical protein
MVGNDYVMSMPYDFGRLSSKILGISGKFFGRNTMLLLLLGRNVADIGGHIDSP